MPITLAVGATADDRAFQRIADRYEKWGKDTGAKIGKSLSDGMNDPKVERGFDRVTDAMSRVRVEQAKLDDLNKRSNTTDAQRIRQSEALARAKNAESRALRDTVRALDEAHASTSRLSNAAGLLTNAMAGTRFGALAKDVGNLSDKFGSIGLATGAAITGIAGVAVGAGAAGKALYDLGTQWDSISDSITMRTGKVGDELTALTDVVGDVGSMTAASLENIGAVVGELSQNMPGLAANSEDIRVMASNLAFLAENGQAVNIHELAQAFTVFGVSASSSVQTLDDIAAVSRTTDVPINSLVSQVRAGAPVFKQFGLDIHSATGFLAAFDNAGLDSGASLTGMRFALKNLSGDSRGADAALKDVITRIKQFHDAGNDPAARDLAISSFGAKNFAPFLDAIETGTLSVENLNKALSNTSQTLQDLQEATDDGKEGWQKLANTIKADLKPAADGVFSMINDQLLLMTGNLGDAFGRFDSASDKLDQMRRKLEEIARVQITPDSALGKMLAPAGVPGGPNPNAYGLGEYSSVGGTGIFSDTRPGWNPSAKPDTKTGSSAPQVPYGALPAVSAGVPMTPEVYSAQSSLLEANHTVEEKQALLNKLKADNTTKADELIKAQNDVEKAKRDQHESEMRFNKTQIDAYEAQFKQLNKAASQLDEVGAKLDQDFGVSKGLAGVVENITKMIGNLAMAPVIGALSGVQVANGFKPGDAGSGLMGMLASSGAFGQQFVPVPGGGQSGSLGNYGVTGPGSLPANFMPSILEDTGSTPSGPQSRFASAMIQQLWGNQIRGKIGGSRDTNTAKGTHDTGTSIDIPIGPDQGALGDEINAWLQAHAQELGLVYSIWRDHGQYPGGGGFSQPGHTNHIDAHFNGASVPFQSDPSAANTTTNSGSFGNFGAPGSKQAIANMIYQKAIARGYNAHEAQSIVAYAVGESGLNPGISGGVQGDDEVIGLFQQKAAFARGGGIDPSQRSNPEANTDAYLNQLERHRNLPIEQALPATSVGGPLASGPGAAPQNWQNLMQQAAGYLGQPASASGGGWSGGGGGGGWSAGGPIAGSPGQGFPLPWNLGTGPGWGGAGGPGIGGAGGFGLGPGGPAAPSQSVTGGRQWGQDLPASGGIGFSGGILGAALSAAAGAAGGAGSFGAGGGAASAAAQLGIQEIGRAIGAAGQYAGNVAGGLLETFSLNDSALGDPSHSWLGRGLTAVTGVRPALPNPGMLEAGKNKQPPGALTPEQAQIGAAAKGNGQGDTNTVNNNITVNNQRATEDGTGRDIQAHLGAQALSGMGR